MTATWLDWCVRRDGPASKQGYSYAIRRSLEDIEGEVKHSTEGSLLAAFGELDKLERRASWHFTVDTDGTTYQHYPLESVCWHCGVAGDRSRDTSLIGNATLIGIEHVDRAGGVENVTLTPAQVGATARLSRDFQRLGPNIGATRLRGNMWEHNWLSSTACPSGLIPWHQIIAVMQEDDMTKDEAIAIALQYGCEDVKLVKGTPPTVYVVDWRGKRVFPGGADEFTKLGYDWDDVVGVSDAVLALVPDAP